MRIPRSEPRAEEERGETSNLPLGRFADQRVSSPPSADSAKRRKTTEGCIPNGMLDEWGRVFYRAMHP
ncbi:MAG: hypothetical protein FWD57_08715 [Polyangiaceae bacterium]|nr:hypothetical protein [Polyangiaceae bacterium]